MFAVLSCVFEQHDLRLVLVAAVICATACSAAFGFHLRSQKAEQAMRWAWLGLSGLVAGSGIWATHFVAMLSFNAQMPVGYDLPITLLSLGIAISIVGGGLWFAAIGPRRSDSLLGGAVVGVGISAMHYTGMAALLIGGGIVWEAPLVAASVLIGVGLAAAALYFAVRGGKLRHRIRGTILLTLGICIMH